MIPHDTDLSHPTHAYALDVVEGRIVAGPIVRAACKRHLDDLKDAPARGFVFSARKADHAINFFPVVLRLDPLKDEDSDGEPTQFHLGEQQKFIIGSLFGWIESNTINDKCSGYRRFRTAYVETAKGSGKSPLAAGIGMYGLIADGEHRAEIFSAAAKKDQAMIMFKDAVSFVEMSPPLSKRLKLSGKQPNVWNIYDEQTNSNFRPISSDEGQSGARPHIGLIDELHEHKSPLVVNMMGAGQKGRKQPLVFIITNSGSDKQTVCGEYHDKAERVAFGMEQDDRFFSYVCSLDTIKRKESYCFDVALMKFSEKCSCNASTIKTGSLSHHKVFAHHAIKTLGGEKISKKALHAKTILKDMLLQEVFATLATQGSESSEIPHSSQSESSFRRSGEKEILTRAECETKNLEIKRKQQTQIGRSTENEKQSTTCLQSSSPSSRNFRAADAGCVDLPRELLEWITATLTDTCEDSFATSAMLELVCSEIMQRLYEGHLPTCRISQHYQLKNSTLTTELPPDDPFVDEECWIKANPMLGITIQKQYIRDQIAAATMPSKQSDVKRLNFCIWTAADNPFIDYGAWNGALNKFDLSMFANHDDVALGLDLSQVRDLTAAVFSRKIKGHIYWWPEFWIPEAMVHEKTVEDKVPYETWVARGWVRTTPGNTISLSHVANDIKELMKTHRIGIQSAPYDRWRIDDFKKACDSVDLRIKDQLQEFGQGFKDMSPAIDAFERDLMNGYFHHPGNPCLDWCAANAVVISDPAGGRKLDKGSNQRKRIDGIIAGIMSHHATSLLPEQSIPSIRWI